jgi:aminoglycoside phosphotransferase (APT) family kinase protein
MALADVDALAALVRKLGRYRPRRRWFRRFSLSQRLALHLEDKLLRERDAQQIAVTASPGVSRWSFAHGDVTARNVLRSHDGPLVLIDWEWAGLYPPLYDLAFLRFSLIDLPGGRAAIDAA